VVVLASDPVATPAADGVPARAKTSRAGNQPGRSRVRRETVANESAWRLSRCNDDRSGSAVQTTTGCDSPADSEKGAQIHLICAPGRSSTRTRSVMHIGREVLAWAAV
jgi:hypothetical protein